MGSVSTIIASYNGEEFIAQAIDSCLRQTHPSYEIIVVDDGSTDATEEIVRIQRHRNVRYIRQDHRGLPAARNTGIAAAAGVYLTFLDCDDLLLPTAVETLLAASEDVRGFVAGRASRIGRSGKPLPGTVGPQFDFQPRSLLFRNPFHVGSALVARRWIESVGGFCELLGACEDWDLWIQLAKAGCPMVSIDAAVSIYRSHDGQMSRDPYLMRDASFVVLERAFSHPCPSADWNAAKTEAYLRGHLRCAARFLCTSNEVQALRELRLAAEIQPLRLQDNARFIREVLLTWESDPAIRDVARYRDHVTRVVEIILSERKHPTSHGHFHASQA